MKHLLDAGTFMGFPLQIDVSEHPDAAPNIIKAWNVWAEEVAEFRCSSLNVRLERAKR